MIEIRSAQAGDALEHFITLSQEYVDWMLAEIRVHYPELDIREFTSEHDYDDVRHKFPGEHTPPEGCLLIATDGGAVCGCVALGRLTDTIAEMRTLFVLPSCRGKGIGKTLAQASLSEARRFGYRTIRLDTLGFMASAQGLYRSLGFRDIPPCIDTSEALKQYICFMELDLGE